jgi:long-chain acyl-CoA synthetase
MSFNLAVVLRQSRNAHPDKPLCHLADQTLSYAQVDEISGRVAASLRNLGVRRGDKVAVQLPNMPHFLFAYFGILKAGAVVVPLNTRLRASEISHTLRDSGSRLLVTFETSADEAVKGAAEIDGFSIYVVNIPGNDQRPVDTKSFDELYLSEDTGDIEPTNPDETAVITYTLGVSGKLEGAKLTHYQLYANSTVNGERLRFRDDDVSMAVLPMFHVFGLSSVLNMAVRFGGTLVLVPCFGEPVDWPGLFATRSHAQTVVDEIARFSCTILFGVPATYYALLQTDTDGLDLSALRVGVCGGAAIPEQVIGAFEEKFAGVVVLGGCGLSEAASTATFNDIVERPKTRSSGKPIWARAPQVADENDTEVPPEADNVERTTRYCVYATILLLVIGAIPWRWDQFFSGQLDWVVLAKLSLLMVSVVIVLWAKRNLARNGRTINTVSASAPLLVALYLASSSMGAFLFGSFLPSVELAFRVMVIGFVVLVLVELVEPIVLISIMSRVLAATAIFIALTGTYSVPVYKGRLVGVFPAAAPNEIAFLAAVPIVYFVWRSVHVDTSYVRILAVMALGAILYLTQSRTTEALIAAIVSVLIIRGTRHGRLRLSMITATIIGLLFTVMFTDLIQSFSSRGGTSRIDTAGSRTIAWDAVLDMPRSSMQTLFGQGVASKLVPVTGQYWAAQVLDSSWFSAFAQAGLIGVFLTVVLVIYAATQALRNVRPTNELWLGLVVLVVVRSIFENGLLDTTTSFIVFMVITMGAATGRTSQVSQMGIKFTPGSEVIALPRTTPAYPG